MSIKNVAITGANSNVGAPLIKALVDSGEFVVTVLARASSQTSYPESVKVVVVDLESVESLTAALKGQDAVVSTVGVSLLIICFLLRCFSASKHTVTDLAYDRWLELKIKALSSMLQLQPV